MPGRASTSAKVNPSTSSGVPVGRRSRLRATRVGAQIEPASYANARSWRSVCELLIETTLSIPVRRRSPATGRGPMAGPSLRVRWGESAPERAPRLSGVGQAPGAGDGHYPLPLRQQPGQGRLSAAACTLSAGSGEDTTACTRCAGWWRWFSESAADWPENPLPRTPPPAGTPSQRKD